MHSSLPRARTTDLVVEEIHDELLLYDTTTDAAHRLNRTAAIVWRACDGTRDVDALVAVLREEVGDLADADLVLVTLDDLRANGLVDEVPEASREAVRRSRRQFIRRVGTVGAAALALPVVHAIAAPEPAAAQTGACTCTCTCTCTCSCTCACACTCSCSSCTG